MLLCCWPERIGYSALVAGTVRVCAMRHGHVEACRPVKTAILFRAVQHPLLCGLKRPLPKWG